MFLRVFTLALLCGALAAAPFPRFSEHIVDTFGNETVKGYVLGRRTLVTWGDRLLWRSLPQGIYRVISGDGRASSQGGWLLDVDSDGRVDIVVNEAGPGGALVWFRDAGTAALIFSSVDLNGDGKPDIVTAGIYGTFVFFNHMKQATPAGASAKASR